VDGRAFLGTAVFNTTTVVSVTRDPFIARLYVRKASDDDENRSGRDRTVASKLNRFDRSFRVRRDFCHFSGTNTTRCRPLTGAVLTFAVIDLFVDAENRPRGGGNRLNALFRLRHRPVQTLPGIIARQ